MDGGTNCCWLTVPFKKKKHNNRLFIFFSFSLDFACAQMDDDGYPSSFPPPPSPTISLFKNIFRFSSSSFCPFIIIQESTWKGWNNKKKK